MLSSDREVAVFTPWLPRNWVLLLMSSIKKTKSDLCMLTLYLTAFKLPVCGPQDFVTRHVAGLVDEHPGVELGALINAAREGRNVEFYMTDTEGSVAVSLSLLLNAIFRKIHRPVSNCRRLYPFDLLSSRVAMTYRLVSTCVVCSSLLRSACLLSGADSCWRRCHERP